MRKDRIVEEVRKAGEDLAHEAGYDVHAFFNLLREREKRHAERLVTRQPVKYADRYATGAAAACAEDGAEYRGK